MIRVATKTSQEPEEIADVNSTLPETTVTFQTNDAVDPFKSGDETSVNTADELSQVANT